MGVFAAVAEHCGLGFEEVHEEYAEFDDLPTSVVLVGVAVLHADLSVAVPAGTGWAESGLVEGELAAHPHRLEVASVDPVEAQGREAALVSNCHAAQVVVERIGTVAKHVARVYIAAGLQWCCTCPRAMPRATLLVFAAESALWRSSGGLKVFGGVFAVARRPRAHQTAAVHFALAVNMVARAR